MIARQYRFHGHGSLNFVYRKGRTVRGQYLSLRYAASRHKGYRLAVVVSRKVSKSAVVRNRIRRRIYEILREETRKAENLLNFDMVITVFDERLAVMPAEELRASVRTLLEKTQPHQ